MNATTTGDTPGGGDTTAYVPTRHELEQAWAEFHAANRTAYNAGCCVRGLDVPNPYDQDSDAWYWWREGHEGRPFAVLTDTGALLAYLKNQKLMPTVPDDDERAAIIRQSRSHRTPRPKPPASPGPTAGNSGPGDALGVVHPTD